MADDVEMWTQRTNETTMTKHVWTPEELKKLTHDFWSWGFIHCGDEYDLCKVRCLASMSCYNIYLECSANRCIVEGRDEDSARDMIINATQSRELSVYSNTTVHADTVFLGTTIWCPTNHCESGQCGQLCEIDGNGYMVFNYVKIHAESVAHLKVSVEGWLGFELGLAITPKSPGYAEFEFWGDSVLRHATIQGSASQNLTIRAKRDRRDSTSFDGPNESWSTGRITCPTNQKKPACFVDMAHGLDLYDITEFTVDKFEDLMFYNTTCLPTIPRYTEYPYTEYKPTVISNRTGKCDLTWDGTTLMCGNTTMDTKNSTTTTCSSTKSSTKSVVAADGLPPWALGLFIFGGSVAFIGIVLLLFYLWKQRRGGRQSQGAKDGAEVEQDGLKDPDNENTAEYGQANRV